ncbi:MAG TPA: DUF885 family protein [Acidimicrobiales bacterium]|nr:DUF885 family protein [Acidimicrobiales bacterium]
MSDAGERELDRLTADFWEWRRERAPRTRDDIPRLARPAGWRPAWSPADVARRRAELGALERRCAALDVGRERREPYTDLRLLASACARARFELDVVASWRHDPAFYLDQTVGTVFDALLRPPPFPAARCAEIAGLLDAIPDTLAAARANLAGGTALELSASALRVSGGAAADLVEAVAQLRPHLDPSSTARVVAAADVAARALDGFHELVVAAHGRAEPLGAVGRAALCRYLHEVALLPYTPEELLAAGRQEWDRAVAAELLEQRRRPDAAWPALPAGADEQCERERVAELEVRAFYESRGLLSQPESLRHYRNAPRPEYLAPLRWLGVTDDLTGPDRLDEDGLSYVPPPEPGLSYFYRANAADPRAGIVHEGAHYQQLALAWRHERPARRHFYDSCPNEGIAFYNEEMLAQAGLFDDAPVTRRIIYNFMRLRALRVEVDVRLALGDWSIPHAAAALEDRVPMDRETAVEEAAFFAATPAQGLSYTTGKLQLLRLLADVRGAQRDEFDLRSFHDTVWRNGNVPFSLLRLELLGDAAEIDRVDELAAGERAAAAL